MAKRKRPPSWVRRSRQVAASGTTTNASSNGSGVSSSIGTGTGLFEDPHRRQEDVELVTQAARQRWPIKPEYREALIRKVVVAGAKAERLKDLLACTRLTLEAERQNQADEHMQLRQPDTEVSQNVVIVLPDNGRDPEIHGARK